MKTIVDDPEGFFEQGGWSFLEPEGEVGWMNQPGRKGGVEPKRAHARTQTHPSTLLWFGA